MIDLNATVAELPNFLLYRPLAGRPEEHWSASTGGPNREDWKFGTGRTPEEAIINLKMEIASAAYGDVLGNLVSSMGRLANALR